MKRAAIILRQALVEDVGLEGFFLAFGTLLLAIAAAVIHPVGPLVVIGSVSVVTGLLLARPGRA